MKTRLAHVRFNLGPLVHDTRVSNEGIFILRGRHALGSLPVGTCAGGHEQDPLGRVTRKLVEDALPRGKGTVAVDAQVGDALPVQMPGY